MGLPEVSISSVSLIIAVFTYLIVGLIKNVIFKKVLARTDLNKVLPIFSGIIGILLSVVIFFIDRTYLSEDGNIFNTLLVGALSGFASTGVDQIYRQLKKSVEGIADDVGSVVDDIKGEDETTTEESTETTEDDTDISNGV